MAGFNRVIIMGNLTRDPEYKQLSSGQAVCRMGVAANRAYRNRQSGDLVQEVCYVDVDVWGAQAESCRQYLAKGRPVLVEGRLKFDSWQDNEGNNRSKLSVVADRVVFMPSAGGAQANDELAAGVESGKEEMGASTAVRQPRAKAADESFAGATKASKKKTVPAGHDLTNAASGEINLPDEPPFQDDLPF